MGSIFLSILIDQSLALSHLVDRFLNEFSLFVRFSLVNIRLGLKDRSVEFSFCHVLFLLFEFIFSAFSLDESLDGCFLELLTFSKFFQIKLSIIGFFDDNISYARLVKNLFACQSGFEFGFFFEMVGLNFLFV